VSEEFSDNVATDKYLVFQLAGQLFAAPLIEIRGVIEYHAAKPIPHTAPYYKGVINIRGEIMGVIDLRERLGLPSQATPTCQLIFESAAGTLAANVDKVLSVSVLNEADLDRRASVEASNKERAYFLAVGKLDEQILTVISLRKVAGSEIMVRTGAATGPS
jgi:purine-binding chemotaxis protein CheW